jgi:UDP-N-acetylglucosamine 1-carboxyvinyltransferase
LASYFIEGGKRLVGDIKISGSKNAALGIIAASMVLDGPCTIDNVPLISDVDVLLNICRKLGATIKQSGEGSITIDPTTVTTYESTHEMTRSIRASYYLLGALLSRFQKAKLTMPGGCDFGTRPINLHIQGFRSMGAKDELKNGIITLDATAEYHSGHLYMDQASVGATINVMIAATKAPGTTVIENAAREPHIVDVANFLNIMGASIKGAGTDTIRIKGVDRIPGNQHYSIIPDQIEAGTYMIAGAVTRGNIVVRNVIPKHMEPLSMKMKSMGIQIEEGDDWIRVSVGSNDVIKATNFKTMPYPGFPTDLQPQALILLCVAEGIGKMHEAVWANRFQYIEELKRMNADVTIAGPIAIVNGPQQLTSARVPARDLRAGAAMVLAALIAEGTTEITSVRTIERGYQDFVAKLQKVGAAITVGEDSEMLERE